MATSVKRLPFQQTAQQRSQGGKGVQALQDFVWWWSQPPQQERPWLVLHEEWPGARGTADPQPGCSHTLQRRPTTASPVGVQLGFLSAESGHFSPPAPALSCSEPPSVSCMTAVVLYRAAGFYPAHHSSHADLLLQPVRSLQHLELCSNPAVAFYPTSSKSRSSHYVHRTPRHLFASLSSFPLHPLDSGLLDLPHTCLEAIVFAVPSAWKALPHTQSLLAFSSALGFGSNITFSGCISVCVGGRELFLRILNGSSKNFKCFPSRNPCSLFPDLIFLTPYHYVTYHIYPFFFPSKY